MIIQAFSYRRIVGVVRIVVIRPVLPVSWIQSLHPHGSPQDLICKPKRAKGMLFIEQFRGNRHRDWEITPKLVIRPLVAFTGPINVLIDSTSVDQTRIDFVVLVHETI